MRKFIFIFLILFLIVLADNLLAEKAGKKYFMLAELVSSANQLDGREILVFGEAIGDLMKRKDGIWLNISDGSLALGIFFKKDEITLPVIKFLGDYQKKGDWLEVKGIFHKNCAYHSGETDLHATFVRVIGSGQKINHPIDFDKLSLAVIVFLAALVLFVLSVLNKKRTA